MPPIAYRFPSPAAAALHREVRETGTPPHIFAAAKALRASAELLTEAASVMVQPDGVQDRSGLAACRYQTPAEAVAAGLALIDEAKARGGPVMFPSAPYRTV